MVIWWTQAMDHTSAGPVQARMNYHRKSVENVASCSRMARLAREHYTTLWRNWKMESEIWGALDPVLVGARTIGFSQNDREAKCWRGCQARNGLSWWSKPDMNGLTAHENRVKSARFFRVTEIDKVSAWRSDIRWVVLTRFSLFPTISSLWTERNVILCWGSILLRSEERYVARSSIWQMQVRVISQHVIEAIDDVVA